MFRRISKRLFVFLVVFIFLIPLTLICASAHSLVPWANYYPPSSVNSTYSFGFLNLYHIDGNNIKYYWNNSTVKSYFNQAVTDAFSVSWQNLITGTEVTSVNAAHITIKYDPITQPEGIVAESTLFQGDKHYYLGNSNLDIVFYRDSVNKSAAKKRTVAAHELGHFWGIYDLYGFNDNLDSIYSNTNVYNAVSRHDFNAMRIALNDLWFNPGGNQVWMYQPTPGTFILRGDVDQNGQITAADASLVLGGSVDNPELTSLQVKLADVDGNGQITAADAQLVLQYSVETIAKFPTDKYEG